MRLTMFLILVFSSLKIYCQVELKIEQSKYDSLVSAAVFYCEIEGSSKEIFRFDFDDFFYGEISWYFDSDKSIFYYTTRKLLATCSSSGNNEIRITFGCFLLECSKVEKLMELKIDTDQWYQNFRYIVIKDEELIFKLNKQEVNRVLLTEVTKNQIANFFK